MNEKITDVLKDFVISSGLTRQELVQAWADSGAIDTSHLPIEQAEGESIILDNEMSVTLFIESLPLERVDMMLVVLTRFAVHFSNESAFEWEAPALDKADCQFLATFDLTDRMKVTKTDGKLTISYCNPSLEEAIPDAFGRPDE